MISLTVSRTFVCLLLSSCVNFGSGEENSEGNVAWQEQYDLGIRYLSEGNYEEAIIAFMAAIEIDPKRPEIYSGLAKAYVGMDDLDHALKILKAGIEETGDKDLETLWDELQLSTSVEMDNTEVQTSVETEPDEAYYNAWDAYKAGVEAYFAESYTEALELLKTAVSTYQISSLYDEPDTDEIRDVEQIEIGSRWDIALMAGAAARVCYALGDTDTMLDYFALAEAHMYIGPPYYNDGVYDDWGGINVTYPVSDDGEIHGVIYRILGPWEEGNGDPESLLEIEFDQNGELLVFDE